jgi:serine/threonine-protein kinase
MTSESFRRIDELFERALELPSQDRAAFLATACDDPDLRRAVLELLAADERLPGFLDDPALTPATLAAGARIGPYQIERLLGRGGMGAVYLARRADVDRPVALKRVESPFRHPELVSRFHAERQILARLEHPAIARLYDAGETEDGVPYLVLEYVDGEPLDTYCDRRRLPLAGRLELFRKLLDAVAHAHQSLLVHRDIKPANVLVTPDGQPKLLDFGIAKRLPTAAGSASLTRGRPMTPAYASPEQVRGEPLTTATDIYSLGVVLHELLVGRSPYRLTSELPHELEAAILDQEPDKPSEALRRPGALPPATELAAERGASPAELERALRGDLDTIVATALRKDPARRYRSVLELGADLDRWRDLLPITARPDTTGYRLRKFVRRRRGSVAVGVLVLILVAGLVASLFQQRNQAARERDRARGALRFVVDVFKEAAPYQQGSREVTAREILATAAKRADAELDSDPDLQGALHRALGQALAGIGRYDDAAPLLARSLAHDRAAHPDSADLAASLEAAGWVEFLRGDFAAAVPHLEEALAMRRQRDPDSAELAVSLHLLATVILERSLNSEDPDLERIEGLFREALAINQRIEGPDGPSSEASLAGLVRVASRRRDLAPAEELARRVLDLTLKRHGPDHPATATSLRSVALILIDEGKFEEAEVLFRRALAILEKTLPADHPEVATAVSDLGLMLNGAGRATEAEPYLRRAYELSRDRLGPDHRTTLNSLSLLASTLQNMGRIEEAVPLRELGLAGEMRTYGEDSLAVSFTLSNFARALAATGQLERAEELARRGLTIREQRLPEGHPDRGGAHRHLGMVLLRAGKPLEAEPHLRHALGAMRRDQGLEFFQTAAIEVALAGCLTQLGRLDEAEELLGHGRGVLEGQFPPAHPLVQEARRKSDQLAAARRKE